MVCVVCVYKQNLKMPKEKSELESEKQTVQWSKEKDKKTNNDLHTTTQKTKDGATRVPLQTGGELRRPGRMSSSSSH